MLSPDLYQLVRVIPCSMLPIESESVQRAIFLGAARTSGAQSATEARLVRVATVSG
jgi:hypothetical protein